MKRFIYRIFVYLNLLVFTASCNDPDSFDCVKKTGEVIEEERILETFTKLVIHHDINVSLLNGDNQKVIVKAGENLMSKISLEVEGNELVIRNNNTCNWTRSYGGIDVFVTSNDLTYIKSSGSGNINSVDTYHIEKQLNIECKDGSGDFNLDVSGNKLVVVNNSLANINLSGSITNLTVGYYYNYGRCHARDLVAQNIFINHLGVNDILVKSNNKIRGNIESTGNVIYYGNANDVKMNITGTGQLIKM
ncbi:head GIN domain-containing protein [Fulvivirgaceae bacterium BMA10]|uniref:Head GIN domain-containing protein n=1 Tax=Splendidivirga corallicola TaxID=3051826 RepID=A0ABT8KQ68_9BACT|nr:head GIN domain-containing protein [Fulvivirgaceae bacterium BMA10]